jgi:xanthine/CO dehydrogenase XdhC/CoxF family maturation factor
VLRNDLKDIISLAERLQVVREPAVLATLISAHGSTYRPLGSMMLGGPSSAYMAGAVSGGCLEGYILHWGHEIVRQQSAGLLRFDADPRANDISVPALGCGGSIEVLVERFTPDHLTFLHGCAAAHEADHASVAACIVDDSALPEVTVRRTRWTDGDDWSCFGPHLKSLCERALLSESSVQSSDTSESRALVHYVRPLTRLVILGAGNDARPLCALGRSLGWHVCVADRRARLAIPSRFPEADQVVASDWWSAVRSIRFTPRTAVVLMTHSLTDDLEILPLLVEQPAAYMGVLGPEHRRSWLLRDVDADLPAAFVSRLRGPIGLNLGDRSPTGIAVSIIAEILAELNGRLPAPLYRPDNEEFSVMQSTTAMANG